MLVTSASGFRRVRPVICPTRKRRP